MGLGVDFNFPLHDAFIEERSASMIHEIALACQCRSEDVFDGLRNDGKGRQKGIFCERCGGDGWLFRDPTLIKGLATSIRQHKNIVDVGVAAPGDMAFSPPINGPGSCSVGRRIGTYDKFTATWPSSVDEAQIIVRGAATNGENLRLNTNLSANEDRLWYEPTSSIWCEDENGVVYVEGADFKLGPGKIISWEGRKPAKNLKYTIKYNALFEWIAFQAPQERIDRDRNLGQLVFLRKRHIAFVNDTPLITDSDKLSLFSRVKC